MKSSENKNQFLSLTLVNQQKLFYLTSTRKKKNREISIVSHCNMILLLSVSLKNEKLINKLKKPKINWKFY